MTHAATRKTRQPRNTGVFTALIGTLQAFSRRRRDRQKLGLLDTHLLRDIGVDPLTANEECTKPFWRA